jgi:AcrR family transcriptional regulator
VSTRPTKRLPPVERRALILDAAGRLFGAHGHDATRLDDVAAAAGVTKPILYRHFASKQDLYLAVLARHRDDLPTFTAGLTSAGPPEARLREVLDGWFAYVEAHAYSWRMLFRDRGGGPEVNAFRTVVHTRARDVLKGLIATAAGDRIPRREHEPLAELLSMGMASLVLWWLDDPASERDAIVDAMTRAWAGVLSS